MDFTHLFFGFDGRINRALWWGGLVALWIVASINGWLNRSVDDLETVTLGPALLQIATFLIGIALLWPWLAIGIKRWHDRDKSGWWMLIVLIPLAGWIWALVELGFLRGTVGTNEYGFDPLPV